MGQHVALVGEAPSRSSGSDPFEGASGRRLARLAGLEDLSGVALYNLLDAWPGSTPRRKGSAFPGALAREASRELLPLLSGHSRVVLCGARVAAAFGFRERYLVWAPGPAGGLWAVLPHPSGVNRWWSDPTCLDAGSRFLRRLIG